VLHVKIGVVGLSPSVSGGSSSGRPAIGSHYTKSSRTLKKWINSGRPRTTLANFYWQRSEASALAWSPGLPSQTRNQTKCFAIAQSLSPPADLLRWMARQEQEDNTALCFVMANSYASEQFARERDVRYYSNKSRVQDNIVLVHRFALYRLDQCCHSQCAVNNRMHLRRRPEA